MAVRRRLANSKEGESAQSLLVSGQQSRHMIVHSPFSLDGFIQAVIQSWLAFIRSLGRCLRALVGSNGRSVSLSLIQAERLEELKERLHVPFDISNHSHQLLLQELWDLAFPGMNCTCLRKNAQWKEMGWQGEDPSTDFRGAGLFGLENLVYLGTHHQTLFQQLRHKTQGTRAQWEYPFAAAGINLTYELTDVLGMAKPGMDLPTSPAGVAFCELLRESDAAFEEVYCAAFALLDKLWLEKKASYMEFNVVMKDVKCRIKDALNSRPRTLQQLQQKLSL